MKIFEQLSFDFGIGLDKKNERQKQKQVTQSTKTLKNVKYYSSSFEKKGTPWDKKDYPEKQFYRWCFLRAYRAPKNTYESQAEKEQIFDYLIKQPSNRITNLKDEYIKNFLINKLQLQDKYKSALLKHPNTLEFLYNLALLDHFFKDIGNERLYNWLDFGGNINEIMTYLTASFEDLLTPEEIQYFIEAKRTGEKINTPEKILNIYSKILWFEKIYRLRKEIFQQTHNREGKLKRNTAFRDFGTKIGEGYYILTFDLVKEVTLFKAGKYPGKRLSQGKYCIVCIDDRNYNKKTFKEDLKALKYGGGYMLNYKCVPLDKEFGLKLQEFKQYEIPIPFLQRNTDKLNEQIYLSFGRLRKKILNK